MHWRIGMNGQRQLVQQQYGHKWTFMKDLCIMLRDVLIEHLNLTSLESQIQIYIQEWDICHQVEPLVLDLNKCDSYVEIEPARLLLTNPNDIDIYNYPDFVIQAPVAHSGNFYDRIIDISSTPLIIEKNFHSHYAQSILSDEHNQMNIKARNKESCISSICRIQ